MSYTFGAATGDDITTDTAGLAGPADNTLSIFAGWFYPTTLTAGRCYFGSGAIIKLAVGSTTSEMVFTTDNTTDGVWTSSGAGITTNAWHFLAVVFCAENTTVAGTCKMYIGRDGIQLDTLSVTNTTPRSGNYTGSGVLTAGNQSVGSTVAFQGDIGWLTRIVGNTTATNTAPIYIATTGAISSNEESLILQRILLPLYRGTPDMRFLRLFAPAATVSVMHMDLTKNIGTGASSIAYFNNGGSAGTLQTITATGGGATYSNNNPPTIPPGDWCNNNPFIRRGR